MSFIYLHMIGWALFDASASDPIRHQVVDSTVTSFYCPDIGPFFFDYPDRRTIQ